MTDGPRTTNWYVITGGPSSGKTTTVNLLRERGYQTTIEHARHYIDLQRIAGRTTEQVRARQLEFQQGVLAMQLEQEAALDPDAVVFLDRAVPDSLAYYRFLGLAPDDRLIKAVNHARYRMTFVLDLLPLAPDYARTEDAADQQRIHDLLTEVYAALPSPLVRVPVMPAAERVQFILGHLA
ncbi:AAA family ATPase [Nocardioides limicola]|uniref:AAA family ATPase n=1 Tax=Nocardioides limicola TaxID=2803368 RepID=UPI00193B234C|nr:ATP-binding protein [Nocardioides sp. DJM-14]